MNEIWRSWVQVVCYRCQLRKWWNVLPSPTIFIHTLKNLIILHIHIDFHYKGMCNYHELVSLLFSLHDCMSLNQNDDWCLFVSRSRRLLHTEIFSPDDWIFDTEIALAIKPTPKNKGQNVNTKYQLNGRDLRYISKKHKENVNFWCLVYELG